MLISASYEIKNTSFREFLDKHAKKTKFARPEYQRQYEWPLDEDETKKISTLASNFLDAASSRETINNYLSTFIIFEDLNKKEFNFVDGLQRFTTINLFIYCLWKEFVKFRQNLSLSERVRVKNTALYDNFKVLMEKTVKQCHRSFIEDNKELLRQSEIKLRSETEFMDYLKEHKERQFSKIIEAIYNAKISYCVVDDSNLALDLFLTANSGTSLKAYEFLKVKCDKLSLDLSEVNDLFDKGKNTSLLANCLNSTGKPYSIKDCGELIHSRGTGLVSAIGNSSFADKVLTGPTKNSKSFLAHCRQVKNRAADTTYFETPKKVGGELSYTRLVALTQNDPSFDSVKMQYNLLFLVAYVMFKMPKHTRVSSTSEAQTSLSKLRKESLKRNLSVRDFKNELIYLYNIYRCCLTEEPGILNESYCGQKELSKLYFWLIECGLNGGIFPNVSFKKLDLEHIHGGVNKNNYLGNLLLLESSINNSLNGLDWNKKWVGKNNLGYKDSILQLPKLFFGEIPVELSNVHASILPDTKAELQKLVSKCASYDITGSGRTDLSERLEGKSENLNVLLDFAIQRILYS